MRSRNVGLLLLKISDSAMLPCHFVVLTSWGLGGVCERGEFSCESEVRGSGVFRGKAHLRDLGWGS